jgi:aspartyl-tRNA(Asn)/glutamyl-tRNA(Gln) amidotransferase subunit A
MHKLTAKQLHDKFLNGDLSALEITQTFLKRIHAENDRLGAFLNIFDEDAVSRAKELDQKRQKGKPLGKLAGIPVAIKDIINIQNKTTTCGSKFLEHYTAPYSATVTRLLYEEDAILIGKTNLDEFAMGSSNEHSAYRKAHNPWNLKCSPGGSSGGSAACVAARLSPFALGTDTGGSIRQPAAFTGTVGFKPTYGRVSRFGLVAFASSFDQIGPITNSIEDTQMIMEVLAQHCEKDSTSLNLPTEDYFASPLTSWKGVRIGIPDDDLLKLKGEVKSNFEDSLKYLKDSGAELVPVDLSLLPYCTGVYYILSTAEASTNLARFDGVRYGKRSSKAKTLDQVYDLSKQEGFGPEVKNRILLGTFVLSSGHKEAYFLKALKVRTLIKNQVNAAFSKCDVIMMPTTPSPAFELGSVHDGVEMYLQDIYTHAANIAGLPAVSLPSGLTQDKKPLGMQFMGAACKDVDLLKVAKLYEEFYSLSETIPESF